MDRKNRTPFLVSGRYPLLFSRSFVFCNFGAGFERSDQSGEILDFAGDDDFGCLAVCDVGERFQTLEGKDFPGRICLAQQTECISICLLDSENCLSLTFSLFDASFLFSFCFQDSSFFFGLSAKNLRFLFTFCNQNLALFRPSA